MRPALRDKDAGLGPGRSSRTMHTRQPPRPGLIGDRDGVASVHVVIRETDKEGPLPSRDAVPLCPRISWPPAGSVAVAPRQLPQPAAGGWGHAKGSPAGLLHVVQPASTRPAAGVRPGRGRRRPCMAMQCKLSTDNQGVGYTGS